MGRTSVERQARYRARKKASVAQGNVPATECPSHTRPPSPLTPCPHLPCTQEKDDGTVAGLALVEVELEGARAERVEELARAGALQAALFAQRDSFRAGGLCYEPTASRLALARGGPGWDDHQLQVRAGAGAGGTAVTPAAPAPPRPGTSCSRP